MHPDQYEMRIRFLVRYLHERLVHSGELPGDVVLVREDEDSTFATVVKDLPQATPSGYNIFGRIEATHAEILVLESQDVSICFSITI